MAFGSGLFWGVELDVVNGPQIRYFVERSLKMSQLGSRSKQECPRASILIKICCFSIIHGFLEETENSEIFQAENLTIMFEKFLSLLMYPRGVIIFIASKKVTPVIARMATVAMIFATPIRFRVSLRRYYTTLTPK